MRRRRILFAHGGHETAKRVKLGGLVGGAVCVGWQVKEWMGCLLDNLGVFGMDAGQWTIATQDEGE